MQNRTNTNPTEIVERLFFRQLDLSTAQRHTQEATAGMDFGELFFEHTESESLILEESQVKKASYSADRGFGLRAVELDRSGYAYSGEITPQALARAAKTVRAIHMGNGSGSAAIPASQSNRELYRQDNPVHEANLADKVNLLQTIDTYIREREELVKQVIIRLNASWRVIAILHPDGSLLSDIQPMTRILINVIVEKNGERESGVAGAGGRKGYRDWLEKQSWQSLADAALLEAKTNLSASPVLAGEMPVVLGPGWPGVMLHEAVGHGLEGDFNRKKLSAFSEKLGKKVANPCVKVVDNGIMERERGSMHTDDEGTPAANNTLIEEGILVGYMQDRMNAALMGMSPTGNGRRESYSQQPMPRMTNTYIENGTSSPEDILASLKRGLYAVNFGGGQVDISSGNYVFECTKAFWVENGKILHPVKNATLMGNGPESMKKISMVGNDLALDGGIGSCGKNGQWVPVCCGQPTVRLDSVTVGGTKTAV